MKRLFNYLKKYFIQYCLGIIALFMVDLLQIKIPQITGIIIDGLKSRTFTRGHLLQEIGTIMILTLIIFAGRFIWRFFIFGSSRKIEFELSNDLFIHLEKLSLNYYNRNKTGDLMAHFTNDIGAVRMGIGPGFMMMFDAVIMTAMVIMKALFSVNIILTLIALIPLPLIGIGGVFLGQHLQLRFKERQEAFARLTDFVQESFSGIRVLKAFVQESLNIKAFIQTNKHNMEKNIRLIRFYSILFPASGMIAGVSFLIALLYGSYLTMVNIITLGQFVAFFAYIEMLIWPMVAAGWCINIFSQSNASLKRINKILDEKPEIIDPVNPIQNPVINGNIQVTNLTFTYPGTQVPQLNQIQFNIRHGQSLAVVGKTGSGKTTLMDLLLRLYDPPRGTIFINNIDILDLPLHILRNHIGYVTQDAYLFSETITENIRIAVDSPPADKIVQAAVQAGIDENIRELADGYNTVIGERGINISGGQKQRIGIARVLIKEPEILIIDDSLSAVDTHTEEIIINNLKTLRKNKTTIIIAHRLSTVKFTDQILVLDKGNVVEYGTHKELFQQKGIYYQLYKRQELEKALEEA